MPAKARRTGKHRRIGLALAGGGPEGAVYEIGALRALDEACDGLNLHELDIYVGVSAGAFIAAVARQRPHHHANGARPGQARAGRAPLRAADVLHAELPRVGPPEPDAPPPVRRCHAGIPARPRGTDALRVAHQTRPGAPGRALRQRTHPALPAADVRHQGPERRFPEAPAAPHRRGDRSRERAAHPLRRRRAGITSRSRPPSRRAPPSPGSIRRCGSRAGIASTASC